MMGYPTMMITAFDPAAARIAFKACASSLRVVPVNVALTPSKVSSRSLLEVAALTMMSTKPMSFPPIESMT